MDGKQIEAKSNIQDKNTEKSQLLSNNSLVTPVILTDCADMGCGECIYTVGERVIQGSHKQILSQLLAQNANLKNRSEIADRIVGYTSLFTVFAVAFIKGLESLLIPSHNSTSTPSQENPSASSENTNERIFGFTIICVVILAAFIEGVGKKIGEYANNALKRNEKELENRREEIADTSPHKRKEYPSNRTGQKRENINSDNSSTIEILKDKSDKSSPTSQSSSFK